MYWFRARGYFSDLIFFFFGGFFGPPDPGGEVNSEPLLESSSGEGKIDP